MGSVGTEADSCYVGVGSRGLYVMEPHVFKVLIFYFYGISKWTFF